MAQTVPTAASTMTTAKPLLPEIALTMFTSLKATYSPPCLVSLITGTVTHFGRSVWALRLAPGPDVKGDPAIAGRQSTDGDLHPCPPRRAGTEDKRSDRSTREG